jgi:hypothetical protein
MKLLRSLALGVLLVVALPATAQAHDPLFSLKYVDGDNIVVASYNVHDFTPGLPITFNVRVYTIAGAPVVYKSLETVVKQRDKVIFDQTFAASDYNDVNWIYAFGGPDKYDITMQFTNHGEHVAQAEFPIQVTHSHSHSLSSRFLGWPTASALLFGIALTLGAQELFRRPAGGREPAAKSVRSPAEGAPGRRPRRRSRRSGAIPADGL